MFDGSTYDPNKDFSRLAVQLLVVKRQMVTGHWFTLAQLAKKVGAPEASISARLRDLRKPKFGGYNIQGERMKDSSGLWRYRMVKGDEL